MMSYMEWLLLKNISVNWNFGLGKELIEGNVVEICRGRKMKTNRRLSKQKYAQLGGKAVSEPSKRRGSP